MYQVPRTVLEPVRETEITTDHRLSIYHGTYHRRRWEGEVIDTQRHSRTVDAVGGGG